MQLLKPIIKPKGLLIILALAVSAASAIWYSTRPKPNLVETDSFSSSPDYFVTQVRVKVFDATGKMIEKLDADKTLHYIAKSKTLLESPYVERYSNSGHWTANADKGVIEDGSNDILLTENVRATKKYLQTEEIKLVADNIRYLDNDKSLTSYGNAALISTQGETSAGKITTYINSEKVVMTGSVRGNYETVH